MFRILGCKRYCKFIGWIVFMHKENITFYMWMSYLQASLIIVKALKLSDIGKSFAARRGYMLLSTPRNFTRSLLPLNCRLYCSSVNDTTAKPLNK